MNSPLKLYEENRKYFWLMVLVGLPLALLLGSIFFREVVWDGFLWRYVWGPVIADARGAPVNGISSGYNPVNTLLYGMVLALALLGINDIIEYYDIEIDERFVLALIPWIILGGSLRTLEDAGVFRESVAPLFISPVIYVVLGVGAILTMLSGVVLSSRHDDDLIRALALSPPLIVMVVLQLPRTLEFGFLVLAALVLFYFIGRRREVLNERYLLFVYGSALLLLSLSHNSRLLWSQEGTNTWELALIPLLALFAMICMLIVLYAHSRFFGCDKLLNIFFVPVLNILIIFSHLFDAAATYRGIKYYGYVEKHVLPALAIDVVGDPAVMFLLKFILIAVVILVMDHYFREELNEYPRLTVILKFTIITLGMAPGVRNMLRLAMGV